MPAYQDQEHFISLFENATEGILLTNSAGNIILINPAAERIFGYTSNEIINKPIEILVPDKYKPDHHSLLERFHSAPSNRAMGYNRELTGRKKDGTILPVEISLSHYQKNGETFVIAFIVDITERKKIATTMKLQQAELEKVTSQVKKLNAELELKVEERTMILREALQKLEQSQSELNQALDKERQLNEIKSRFVSMASHEFRTPLSTVLSSATLLEKYTQTDEQEKRNKHIEKIKGSAKHLNEILEDFLSLGKLDEGKVHTQTVSINLQDCLLDIVEELAPMLKPHQYIEQKYTGTSIIHSDKKLVRNIIINLISNAIKFSGEGKKITIQTETTDNLLLLSITDNGIGISEEDQKHLFSSFFRAANATNIHGTGLGLHIVKRYVGLLNGLIDVKSQLNKGTVVTISIPLNNA